MDVYWCTVDGNFYDMHYVVDEGSQIIGIPSLCRFMGLIDSMTVKFYRDAGVGPEWPRAFVPWSSAASPRDRKSVV